MPHPTHIPLYFMRNGERCKTYVAKREKVDTMHLMKMIIADDLPFGKVCMVKCFDPRRQIFTLHVDPVHAREFLTQLEAA